MSEAPPGAWPRKGEHQDMQELRERLKALRERVAHVMVRL
jgi:hypothetical protein